VNSAEGWHCLTIAVPSAHAEVVSAWCFDLGSCGLELEEAGEKSRLKAYFAAGQELSALCRRLDEQLKRAGLAGARLRADHLGFEDWEREWRRFFQPIRATPRLVVHPSWIPVETGAGQVAVAIDPKMAFGTGGHESTQLCLELLDGLLVPGDRCLDLGTGSGLLGIAAGLLGAGSLRLVDTDPLALENAAENLARNGVEAWLGLGSIEAVAGVEFDLVLANIQSSVLGPMLGQVRQALRPGGRAVFSGLLVREEETFCRQVEAAGLRVDQARRRHEWLAVAAQRA
jgi:ribosomal protein L11 methyltransferase